MSDLWSSNLPWLDGARRSLERIIDLSAEELPFAAQVAQFALECSTAAGLEAHLVSLYRIGLDTGNPFIPDMADSVLCMLEQTADHLGGSAAAPTMPH